MFYFPSNPYKISELYIFVCYYLISSPKYTDIKSETMFAFFFIMPPTYITVCVCVLVTQSCLPSLQSDTLSPPSSSVHVILQARILEWFPFPSPGNLLHSGIKTRSPTLQIPYCLSHQGNPTYITSSDSY